MGYWPFNSPREHSATCLDTRPMLLKITMSTKDVPEQKISGTADASPRLLPQHVYLGVDAEGYRHHLDRDAGLVTRFDDAGKIERRTDLSNSDLGEYLLFVAEQVGWRARYQIADWDLWGRK